jgi:uncharacterized protein (TIGR00296 family)
VSTLIPSFCVHVSQRLNLKASAFEDHRFRKISIKELPTLECAVTLLTNFEHADGPLDWELGKHGIRIKFRFNGRQYGATYLPDVATEQGWTKEEALDSLLQKAGWRGNDGDWKTIDGLALERYQGKKVTLEFAEYKSWRDWVDKQARS